VGGWALMPDAYLFILDLGILVVLVYWISVMDLSEHLIPTGNLFPIAVAIVRGGGAL